MIIDVILDRKDDGTIWTSNGNVPYNSHDFYMEMMNYGGFGEDIARAMDFGEEQDVKRMICFYIDRGNYNPEIKDYVNSVNWL